MQLKLIRIFPSATPYTFVPIPDPTDFGRSLPKRAKGPKSPGLKAFQNVVAEPDSPEDEEIDELEEDEEEEGGEHGPTQSDLFMDRFPEEHPVSSGGIQNGGGLFEDRSRRQNVDASSGAGTVAASAVAREDAAGEDAASAVEDAATAGGEQETPLQPRMNLSKVQFCFSTNPALHFTKFSFVK